MPDLSLARRCIHDSPRADHSSRDPLTPALEPATFLEALDFLQHAGVRELRLLRGEPTLHPDFAWMLTRALERGFRPLIATTGRMPNAILKKLERLPPEAAGVLVRVAAPGESSPAEHERQANLFRRLGPRVQLSLEVHSPAVKLDFLLELIERYGLAHRVHLELVPPPWDGLGDGPLSRLAAELGPRLASFCAEAAAAGVQVELGGGFEPVPVPRDRAADGEGELLVRCEAPLPDGKATNPPPIVTYCTGPCGPLGGVTVWAVPGGGVTPAWCAPWGSVD